MEFKEFFKEWLKAVGLAFAGLFACIAIGYALLAIIGVI
jgi:hypothetical protein